MAKERLLISNSRINKFRTCQRMHYYKYVEKLVPKKKGIALSRGSTIHACLENYNSGKSWKKPWQEFKKYFDETYFEEEKVELGDVPQMIYDLMENYVECYQDEDIEYLENEREFTLEIDKNIDITGFIDFVAQDDKGGIWLGETKTHARFPEYDIRVFNMQSALYVWAMQELGDYKKIKGIIWNYIKAKTPTKPQLLKNGQLSTRKIDSTPLAVERAIKEYGLDIKKYQDLISAQSYDDYFKRYKVPVSQEIVKSVVADTKETAKMILNFPDLKARNLGRNCTYCDYKSICQAELLGLDAEFIKKADFEISQGRGRDAESTDSNS